MNDINTAEPGISGLVTRRGRILIVDDEISIRWTLGECLRRDGYEVREAADALSALEQLNEAEFDVVVTDISMPGISGVELLHRIHATATQVQVVMMTGEPTIESASESLRAGAADYILKPITMMDIRRVVANAVRLKALHDSKRQLEAENRAYRENLERLVDERTGQLRETEQRLDHAMRLAQLAAWEYDVASGFFTFGDRYYALHGTTSELEGGNMMSAEAFAGKFMHPDDAHLVGEEVAKAVATADPDYVAQVEARIFRRDGELRQVLMHIGIAKDAAGRTIQLRGANQDITERKKSEQELRKLWRAVEQTPATVVITNASGNIEYVNPKFVEITGYTAAEALGQNPRVLKSGLHAPGFYQAMWNTLVQGNVWHGEIRNKKKNGDLYWESACISPVRDPKGEITHFIAVKEDITERKRTEEDLQQAKAQAQELLAMSILSTAHANELAVRAELANSAKSEFLANMSHEIRTPLNGVLGMIGLLLDTDLSIDQLRYAQTVRASGEALLALINNILDFSKIEARKLELETLDFSLHNLLDDFTGMMALRAHEKGLVLGCVVAPEVPSDLQGDPGRLRQILINLTGNAIKFADQGEVIIRVSLISESPSEVQLRFAVRDTGIGIPADKLGRLFTKFSQVDSSITRIYGGTGLGLAISKQLAELMGGEIGVRSEPGQGSEFWFTIGLAKAPARSNSHFDASGRFGVHPLGCFTAPDTLKGGHRASRHGDNENCCPAREPAVALASADLRGVRVLVVDDRPVNREILLALLKSWGLRPAEAADGPSAMEALTQAKAAQDPFAIAILDMQMPGMDGISLGRAIKSDPNLRDTRLMICTSLGQPVSDQQWEQIGFVAFLTKPVRRPELYEALETAISGKKTTVSRVNPTPGFALGQGFRPARILVAEDNITNQQVAVGILQKLGLRVEVAANGAEAVHALETIPYDLVLMDVQMPVMDGFTATRQVRDLQSRVLNHQVPIIAMTAHALPGDREKCLSAGMNDYVTKPVEVSALVAVLKKWLPPGGECCQPQPLAGEPEEKVAASPHEEEIPVFDRAGLMDRVMNDEELAQVVIEGFLEDLPGQIKQLKSYAAAGEARNVEQQAHKIKGASAAVGGETLRALAAVMEQAGQAGDLAIISARMAELDARFAALKGAMQKEAK